MASKTNVGTTQDDALTVYASSTLEPYGSARVCDRRAGFSNAPIDNSNVMTVVNREVRNQSLPAESRATLADKCCGRSVEILAPVHLHLYLYLVATRDCYRG